MFLHYLKVAWRNIWKNKFRFLFVVISLAVGIFIISITSFVIRDFTTEYTQFDNYSRLCQLEFMKRSETGNNMGTYQTASRYSDFQALMNSGISGVESGGVLLSNIFGIEAEKEDGKFYPFMCYCSNVNKDFFATFSAKFRSGGVSDWSENSAVLSKTFAQKVFINKNPIGKTIRFNEQYFKVVGVIDNLGINRFNSDVYLSVTDPLVYVNIYMLLSPGVSADDVNEQMEKLNIYPDLKTNNTVPYLQTFVALSKQSTQQRLIYSLVIFISILILLAGLFNYLNLMSATFIARVREISLRNTLGANFWGVYCTFAFEILFVLLTSFLLSFGLTELIFFKINSGLFVKFIGPISFNITEVYKWQLIWAIIILIFMLFVTVVLFLNVYRKVQREGLISRIKGKNKHTMRNFSIAFQLFICFLMTGCMIALFLQNQKFMKENTNYLSLSKNQCEEVFHLSIEDQYISKYKKEITEAIKTSPDVSDLLYMAYPFNFRVYNIGYKNKQNENVQVRTFEVDTNYFSFFKLPAPPSDLWKENRNALIITDSLNRRMMKDSINALALNDTTFYQIAAIVPHLAFKMDTPLQTLRLMDSQHKTHLYIKCKEGRKDAVEKQITDIVRLYVPDTYPFVLSTLRKELETDQFIYFMMQKIFFILSLLSLLITLFSIFSAVTLDTQYRQKEMALRKVNGAKGKDIFYMLGKTYLVLLGVSFIISFPIISMLINQITAGFSNQIEWWNPLLWLSLILLVGGFVFITIVYHILQSSRINPAEVVKSE